MYFAAGIGLSLALDTARARATSCDDDHEQFRELEGRRIEQLSADGDIDTEAAKWAESGSLQRRARGGLELEGYLEPIVFVSE